MLLKDAVAKAKKDKMVKELSRDHILCSAFAFAKNDSVDEWTLHYYSPKTKQMVDCFVGKSVTIGDETPAIKEMEELDVSSVKVSSDRAFKIAKKNFQKKEISSMLSLHKKKRITWSVSIITQDMMITRFDIDAISGKIIDKQEESLLRVQSVCS